MRRPLVILGLLAIFAAAPLVGALEPLLLNESTSHIDISENSVHEKITLHYVVAQSGDNALQDSIFVHGALSGVSVYDLKGALAHSVENTEGGFSRIKFYLRETLMAGDHSTVIVEFTKDTTHLDGSYEYKIEYMWSITPVSSQIIAMLPNRFSLLGTSQDPSEIKVLEDKLQVRWSGVQENQFYTAITFRGESQPAGNQEGGQPEAVTPYVILLSGAAASLAVAGVFLKIRSMRKLKEKIPREVKALPTLSRGDVKRIMGMLTAHESKVVKELIRKDNLTQRALCDRTGIPKATMSRILQRLEGKGVVTRVGYGGSKRVLLSKWARRLRY